MITDQQGLWVRAQSQCRYTYNVNCLADSFEHIKIFWSMKFGGKTKHIIFLKNGTFSWWRAMIIRNVRLQFESNIINGRQMIGCTWWKSVGGHKSWKNSVALHFHGKIQDHHQTQLKRGKWWKTQSGGNLIRIWEGRTFWSSAISSLYRSRNNLQMEFRKFAIFLPR